MLPVFNEYIQFLQESTGKVLPIQEGKFWIDNQIIKGFDYQGSIYKFYKVNISEDLKVSITKPNNTYTDVEKVDLCSWTDLIKINKNKLDRIEKESLTLIKEKIEKYYNYVSIIPTSTGKDSTVMLYLIRTLYPNTKAIFNNTTLDCANTYRMAKRINNCEIINPKQGFYDYIKETQMIPSRFSRFCCRIFKTGEMVNQLDKNINYLIFLGMRNEESEKRKNYQDEINNPEWKTKNWKGILPIRRWTELDIWLYILDKNLDINLKYKQGYQRVGCHIACPYYSKGTWVLDKYWYPKMRARWEDILREDFIKNNKWIILNCTVDEYVYQAWNGGVFRKEPNKMVIDEYCKYNNIKDENMALQYFNKVCCICNKKIKSKDVLGMNLKYHGRNINKFYCKKCFIQEEELTEQGYEDRIKQFKEEGCVLF